jgi:hypothetical protein
MPYPTCQFTGNPKGTLYANKPNGPGTFGTFDTPKFTTLFSDDDLNVMLKQFSDARFASCSIRTLPLYYTLAAGQCSKSGFCPE